MKEKKSFLKKLKGLFIKETNDDRIKDEINKLCSKGLLPILTLSIISIMIKVLVFHKSIGSIDLEIAGIVGAIVIVFGYAIYYKIPILNSNDENILKIQYSHRMKAFYFVFWLYIFGDFIKILVSPDYDRGNSGLRYLIWFLVAMSLCFQMISKGLLTLGSGKNKEKNQKNLKYMYIFTAPLYGLFMAREKFFTSDPDIWGGIIAVLCHGLLWGVLSYFLMKSFYKNSEKNADKLLEDIDEE